MIYSSSAQRAQGLFSHILAVHPRHCNVWLKMPPRVQHHGMLHHCGRSQSFCAHVKLTNLKPFPSLQMCLCVQGHFLGGRSLGVTFFSIVGLNVRYICDEACGKAPLRNLLLWQPLPCWHVHKCYSVGDILGADGHTEAQFFFKSGNVSFTKC